MIKHTDDSNLLLLMGRKYNLTMTSGYRSPEHNAKIGGSKTSDHIKGQAYDFAGSFASMKAFAKWAHGTGKYKQVIFENKDYETGRYIGGHMDHVHVAWHVGESAAAPSKVGGDDLETSISKGDEGYFVKTFQIILKWLGFYKGGIDGDFGSITEQATKDFQESRDLQVDGIAGTETLNKIFGTTSTNFFIRLP